MSVGDRWTSGALSFGAAESHRLKVWEIQELHFSQVTMVSTFIKDLGLSYQ